MRLLLLTAAVPVCLLAAPVLAGEALAVPPPPAEAPPPAAPERPQVAHPFFVYESFGVNVFTYQTPAAGGLTNTTITPSNKVILFEQLGVGYWVHPNVRVQLTGMLGETVSGLSPGTSSFTLAAVIPCVIYTNSGFFAGGGPMVAPRAFGNATLAVGLFSVAGYALSLGPFSVALAVQAPLTAGAMDSFAITPAAILGERF